MTLNDDGYLLMQFPELTREQTATFDNLPLDEYCGGKQRHRRFSQYRLYYRDERWQLEILPHRSFIQPKQYNSLVGGFLREFQPLELDPTLQVASGADAIPLDRTIDWAINVHQYRIVVSPDIRGISVPEGPHRDNHQYVMIAVFDRQGITEGVTSLMPTGGGEPFYSVAIPKQHALILDDTRMWHDATEIVATDKEGHRDLWVVVYDEWEERRYGDDFEQASLSASAEGGDHE